ncbi:MAG TPA: DinB family protein [Candidatus Sulfotelmatobacter sp.]|nr:DinB family protein [Candidatus Sulfotelmatobacter sp.]
MRMIEPMLMELDHEAKTTRRLLERVPGAHLGWAPHAKSMTLGRLATHIAEIPGWISTVVQKDEFDVAAGNRKPGTAGSVEELLRMFDENIQKAQKTMQALTEDQLRATWRLLKGGQALLAMPRMGVLRALMLNHLIHHRGQLSVYLRLKDVPLPSIYGPTADEPM